MFHLLLGGLVGPSFLVISHDLPVTLVNLNLQGRGLLLDLVTVCGQSTCVDVINFGNAGESNELDDYINGLVDIGEVNDASELRGKSTDGLHEGDSEGTSWVGEVKWLIGHILHHSESLAHVALHLQVHEDSANKTSSKNCHCSRGKNDEGILHDDGAYEGNHEELDAEDEHGRVEGIVNLILIHVELSHDSPVEGFEGHGVGVISESKIILSLDNFLQVLEILLLLIFQ